MILKYNVIYSYWCEGIVQEPLLQNMVEACASLAEPVEAFQELGGLARGRSCPGDRQRYISSSRSAQKNAPCISQCLKAKFCWVASAIINHSTAHLPVGANVSLYSAVVCWSPLAHSQAFCSSSSPWFGPVFCLY